MRELAGGCVRYVQEALKLELDYSTDTLPLLDHYLSESREDPKPELRGLIAPAAGAYFGELVQRQLGDGRWHCTGDEFEGYRLEFERCFLYFNPIGMALEAMMGEAVEGSGAQIEVLPADRKAVKEALDRLGPVREEDYYRLSVRFEVLETIHNTLVHGAVDPTQRDLRLGPEVYAAALGDGEGAPN